jgi:hypothetical protein
MQEFQEVGKTARYLGLKLGEKKIGKGHDRVKLCQLRTKYGIISCKNVYYTALTIRDQML